LIACLREPSRRRGAVPTRHTLPLALGRWRTTIIRNYDYIPEYGLSSSGEGACHCWLVISAMSHAPKTPPIIHCVFRFASASLPKPYCARRLRPPIAQSRVRLHRCRVSRYIIIHPPHAGASHGRAGWRTVRRASGRASRSAREHGKASMRRATAREASAIASPLARRRSVFSQTVISSSSVGARPYTLQPCYHLCRSLPENISSLPRFIWV
jgi:hypothetical protein